MISWRRVHACEHTHYLFYSFDLYIYFPKKYLKYFVITEDIYIHTAHSEQCTTYAL